MNISVLGATGSIGTQTLDVVRKCLPNARVRVLTGNANVPLLAALTDEFRPDMVWVPDGARAIELEKLLQHKGVKTEILTGDDELIACAVHDPVEVVVNALVGKAGLSPTLAAIRAGKDIALANKESLVTAGGLIMGLARDNNVRIVPIDSEHSAILQCLQGKLTGNDVGVEKIILTASGGPFRTWPQEHIAAATAADALRHPNWTMGPKITIDSATLMNKGLELIEAMWLFGQPMENIEILVHPQSIIHSMVQFIDGAIMAQMGTPDMRLPILYALAGPDRVSNNYPRLDFLTTKDLTFEAPDMKRFPCLALAKHAADVGGTLPAVMNAVNEWAVGRYLNNKIDFYGISALIAEAFDSYTVKEVNDIADIHEAEAWAMEFVNLMGTA
ncbi:MAG: 1-deoxy-D-xylulose-5-phosphate reductoisomerase [Defluviitaleaceae bacterium]|nr:1-deoxy-D-xylulose-5-phosphate reductoisomerase [Defluviitaleaceae bacterium]